MKKKKLEQYSDGLRQTMLSKNLPSDAILGDSFLTVVGRSEVWIENYKGILLYEDGKILVQAGTYIISIEGTGLIISHYMEEHMMIRGNILKITHL